MKANNNNINVDLYILKGVVKDPSVSGCCFHQPALERIFDWVAAFFLPITLPFNIFIIRNPAGLVANIFTVLAGKNSWIGYAGGRQQQFQLPPIRTGIITPIDELRTASLNDAAVSRINLLYAKDYSASLDAELFLKCYRLLGRKSGS